MPACRAAKGAYCCRRANLTVPAKWARLSFYPKIWTRRWRSWSTTAGSRMPSINTSAIRSAFTALWSTLAMTSNTEHWQMAEFAPLFGQICANSNLLTQIRTYFGQICANSNIFVHIGSFCANSNLFLIYLRKFQHFRANSQPCVQIQTYFLFITFEEKKSVTINKAWLANNEMRSGTGVKSRVDTWTICRVRASSFASITRLGRYFWGQCIPLSIVHPVTCCTKLFWSMISPIWVCRIFYDYYSFLIHPTWCLVT